MEDVQKPLLLVSAVPPKAAMQILDFATGHRWEGRLHGSRTDSQPHTAHQADGCIAHFRVAATARTAQRARRQLIFSPAVPPGGQGAAGHAKLRGHVGMPQPQVTGPMIEGHRAAAGISLRLALRALGRPSAFPWIAGAGVHGLLSFVYDGDLFRRLRRRG